MKMSGWCCGTVDQAHMDLAPAVPLLVCLPADEPEKAIDETQVPGPLPAMWETWMKFLTLTWSALVTAASGD